MQQQNHHQSQSPLALLHWLGKETLREQKLSLFPNPAKAFTKVSCEGLKQIEVYNNLGSLVNVYKSNTNVYTLATSSLAKGLYLVKVTTIDNKHYTQKIVVE